MATLSLRPAVAERKALCLPHFVVHKDTGASTPSREVASVAAMASLVCSQFEEVNLQLVVEQAFTPTSFPR